MSINRKQAEAFLSNELKKKAQALGAKTHPQQAIINMAELAKVKIKVHAPSR